MAIRLSGMSSGLDTDAIVTELVKAYSKKTDTYKGEQTKVTWKSDLWSNLNKKTKSFYSKLSAYRFSSAYNLKKTSVSDSTKATVTASNSAVNGTQSLNITSLAKTGYLTGGKLTTNTGAKASGSTKLSNLGYTGDGAGSITVGTGSNAKSISVDGDMTVSQLVDKLKSAGVNASFDETNQRIFVSSTKSGKDNDFTLTADDANGAKALKSFGLLVKSNSATELDSKYAALAQGAGESDDDYNTRLSGLLNQYNQNAAFSSKTAPAVTANITAAQKYISAVKTTQRVEGDNGISGDDLELLKKSDDKLYSIIDDGAGNISAETYTKRTDANGKTYYTKDSETGDMTDEEIAAGDVQKYYAKTGDDGEGNTVTQLVTDEEAAFNAENGGFVKTSDEYLTTQYDGLTKEDITAYRKAQADISEFNAKAEAEVDGEGANTSTLTGTAYESYRLNDLKDSIDNAANADELDSIAATLTAEAGNIDVAKETADVAVANSAYLKSYAEQFAATDETDTVLQNLKDRIAQADANLGFGAGDYSEGAVRVDASDAVIYLNGAQFTSESNTFSINGLTINAMSTTTTEEKIAAGTADGDALSITTATDSQSVYDSIKDLFSEYNSLINELTTYYNAPSAKGYDMLTDDEKSEMTDDQVEKWETKIKSSLLRNDSTLNGIMTAMTGVLQGQYSVNGKNYSLASFGIQTLGYSASEKNEYNAYHIYGDADDDSVADKDDKLMAAINKDPELVTGFFQQVFQRLYSNIADKMTATSLSSSMTIYNDKEMAKEYSSWNTTISQWEKKVTDMEDSYYRKFSAMETALSKMQNNASQLSSYLGG